nr:cyclin-dependent protein kinase inhibitor SMR4 [Ipomoea batatas]
MERSAMEIDDDGCTTPKNPECRIPEATESSFCVFSLSSTVPNGRLICLAGRYRFEMERSAMEIEDDGCTTPKNPECRIPEPTVSPPAPKKKPIRRRRNKPKKKNNGSSSFFNPPDLDSAFIPPARLMR